MDPPFELNLNEMSKMRVKRKVQIDMEGQSLPPPAEKPWAELTQSEKRAEIQRATKSGDVLAHGRVGFIPWVVAMGPVTYVAYVGAPNSLAKKVKQEEFHRHAHGGFSFKGHSIPGMPWLDDEHMWYGWDYGHSGDYTVGLYGPGTPMARDPLPGERVWTVYEVSQQAKAVANDLLDLVMKAGGRGLKKLMKAHGLENK